MDTNKLFMAVAERVLQSACDLPGLSSPDDDPEVIPMLPHELTSVVVSALEVELEPLLMAFSGLEASLRNAIDSEHKSNWRPIFVALKLLSAAHDDLSKPS